MVSRSQGVHRVTCQLNMLIVIFHVIPGARWHGHKAAGGKVWYLRVHFLFGINSICCGEDIIQEYKNVAFQVECEVRAGRENRKGRHYKDTLKLASEHACWSGLFWSDLCAVLVSSFLRQIIPPLAVSHQLLQILPDENKTADQGTSV